MVTKHAPNGNRNKHRTRLEQILNVPSSSTAFGLRRKVGENWVRCTWLNEGGVSEDVWPIGALTVEFIVDKWGPGWFKVGWFKTGEDGQRRPSGWSRCFQLEPPSSGFAEALEQPREMQAAKEQAKMFPPLASLPMAGQGGAASFVEQMREYLSLGRELAAPHVEAEKQRFEWQLAATQAHYQAMADVLKRGSGSDEVLARIERRLEALERDLGDDDEEDEPVQGDLPNLSALGIGRDELRMFVQQHGPGFVDALVSKLAETVKVTIGAAIAEATEKRTRG